MLDQMIDSLLEGTDSGWTFFHAFSLKKFRPVQGPKDGPAAPSNKCPGQRNGDYGVEPLQI